MTDGEPEPFRMSTNADDGDPDDGEAADTDPADGDPAPEHAAPGVEGLGDLIDEAARAADEQARREQRAQPTADRSGDVWGRADDEDEDLDAVWAAASERHRGSHVFDDMLGTEDTWRSSTRIPPPAADPAFDVADLSDSPASPGDDEPEVFKLQVDEDATGTAPAPPDVVADAPAPPDVVADAPSHGDEPLEDPADGSEPRDEAAENGETHDDPLWGLADPGDTEDVWRPVDDIDELDPWGSPAEAPADRSDEEDRTASGDDRDATEHGRGDGPEPFRFAAGPQTSAPAAVPDHVEDPDDDEPDLFAFAFADPTDGARSDPDDRGPDDDSDDAAAVDTDAVDDVEDPGDLDGVDDPFAVDDVGAVHEAEVPDAPDGVDDPDDLDDLDDLDDDMVWSVAAVSAEEEEPPMMTESAPDNEDGADEDTWSDVEDEVDLWTAAGEAATDEDDQPDEPPLAETVRPRPDAGWDDQSRDGESWALDAVTVQVGDVVELRDEDDEDPSPISTREPDPPFETGSSALGDVLEDLLGDLDELPPTHAAAGPSAGDHAPPTTDDLPRGEPAPAHDDALPADAPDRRPEAAAGTALDAPVADAAHTATPSAPTSPPPPPVTPPPPASDAGATGEADASDEDPAAQKDVAEDPAAQNDAATGEDAGEEPTAEEDAEEDEEVTPEAPTGLSFSSSASPKKRGLFGR